MFKNGQIIQFQARVKTSLFQTINLRKVAEKFVGIPTFFHKPGPNRFVLTKQSSIGAKGLFNFQITRRGT